MKINFKKLLKDIFDVIIFFLILYFFCRGVIDFYQDKLICEYQQSYFFDTDFVFVYRGSVNQISQFVNTTGLFNNGLLLGESERILNCSFVI